MTSLIHIYLSIIEEENSFKHGTVIGMVVRICVIVLAVYNESKHMNLILMIITRKLFKA